MIHEEMNSILISIGTRLCLCRYYNYFSLCIRSINNSHCHEITKIEKDHVVSGHIPEIRIVRKLFYPERNSRLLRKEPKYIDLDFKNSCASRIGNIVRIHYRDVWMISDFYEKVYEFEIVSLNLVRSLFVLTS